MVTSRGCPIGCTFCTIHEGKKVRYQAAKRIFSEMVFLKTEYQTTHINFLDPMFLANRARVYELCERLVQGNIGIRWACEAHVNYANKDLFYTMKRAGCETIYFGLESGSNKLLKNIGKKCSVEQGRKAVEFAHHSGLKPVGFFMLGLPGEDKKLTCTTIDFALSLPLDMAVFSITVPFPGSQLYEELIKHDNDFDIYNWDGYCNTGILGKCIPAWNRENLSYRKLTELQSMAMRRFHLRPRMIWRHIKTFKYATPNDIKALLYVTLKVLK